MDNNVIGQLVSVYAGRVSESTTVMGSLAGLVSWDLDSRQQLQDACIITYGQRRRSFLVCIAGAQVSEL